MENWGFLIKKLNAIGKYYRCTKKKETQQAAPQIPTKYGRKLSFK